MISLEMSLWNRPHLALRGESPGFSRVTAGNMGFLSSYGWGPQGPARVALGQSSLHACYQETLGISLQSVPDPRSSSGDEDRTSGFHSSADMDLGVPMEFQQGSQASSHMETCKSAFLSSCNSSVRLPVELA